MLTLRKQATRNILPVTLREGGEQAQPEEESENDNAWTRPNIARSQDPMPRIARTLSTGTNMDATSGTEYTELVEPGIFSGTVAPFASDKGEATKLAKRNVDSLDDLRLWMNAS